MKFRILLQMGIKRLVYTTLALFGLGILMSLCNIRQAGEIWYEETKAGILKQSALTSDSIAVKFNSDRSLKKEFYFYRGHKFMTKSYRKNALGSEYLCSEYYFSYDGDFDLRREFCENGTLSFEGIGYKTSLYGPFTRFYCNGKIQQQGYRYRSEKIGIWKTYDEHGKLLDESDLKHQSALEALPQLTR